jgi:L-glyceraldehyde 3-phosphate reductase
MVRCAFDLGITHFDLANNYGPPPGSAEETFGRILAADLRPWRDELIISTKAGWGMWPGPYGDWGSRKYLIASLDQSLKRMGWSTWTYSIPIVPIHIRRWKKTMMALDYAVRSGRALYVGISSYSPEGTREAAKVLASLGTRCLIHQPKYSMLVRDPEQGLLDAIRETGLGCIVFSPLAQGLLTDRYLNGVPPGSRASKPYSFLKPEQVTPALEAKVSRLNDLARERGQTLAQMALAWVLRQPEVTSALIGASRVGQIDDAVGALAKLAFGKEELQKIEGILRG